MKIFTTCFKFPSLDILQFACTNNTNIDFLSCIINYTMFVHFNVNFSCTFEFLVQLWCWNVNYDITLTSRAHDQNFFISLVKEATFILWIISLVGTYTSLSLLPWNSECGNYKRIFHEILFSPTKHCYVFEHRRFIAGLTLNNSKKEIHLLIDT